MLGLVSDDILFRLSECIKDKDAPAALKMIDSFFNDGKDIFQIVLGLITHFRNIAVAKISKDAGSILDYTKDKLERYKAVAERFTIEEILYVIYTLSNTIDFIRKSGLSRAPLEAAVIKLSRAGSIGSLEDILDRIEKLRRQTAIPAVALSGSGTRSEPDAAVRTNRDTERPQAADRPPKPENDPLKAEGATDLDEMLSAWSGVINHIMPKKVSIAHYLQEGYPIAIEGGKVVIGFPKELRFHKEVLEEADNRKIIEDAIKAKLNLEMKVEFRLEESRTRGGSAGSSGSDADELDGSGEALDDMAKSDSDPIVNTALEMFGGEISPETRMKRKAR
jgi:DNA polymerase-3 subunit gamma/tau